MNLKLLRTILVSTAVSSSLCVSSFAMGTENTLTPAGTLNLSPVSPITSPVVPFSPKGSLVVVGSAPGYNWSKDLYLGTTVYFNSASTENKGDPEDFFGRGKIKGAQVCMFDGASLDANLLGTYANGTEMQVLDELDGWYKVKIGTVTGFVSIDNFSLDENDTTAARCLSAVDNAAPKEAPVPDDSTLGQKIVDTAEKYLGTPYVWGGTTTKGFDCSGFVQYVYKECGYSINRTAAAIYKEGTYVDKAALQVGDAICFASHTESIGHVGIYIGNGQFIHASSGSGRVVISSLDLSYYASHYVGARHIV